MKYLKGDIVEITSGLIFRVDVNKGDLAVITGEPDNQMLMITGDAANQGEPVYQYDSDGVCIKLHFRPTASVKAKPFKPIVIEIDRLEEAEILKSIMHVHNKVADCSFFDLGWTPDREAVRSYMKWMYGELERVCPGWSKYEDGGKGV